MASFEKTMDELDRLAGLMLGVLMNTSEMDPASEAYMLIACQVTNLRRMIKLSKDHATVRTLVEQEERGLLDGVLAA